jgi:hypothetical protein
MLAISETPTYVRSFYKKNTQIYSDCCLVPTQQFFSYIMARTSNLVHQKTTKTLIQGNHHYRTRMVKFRDKIVQRVDKVVKTSQDFKSILHTVNLHQISNLFTFDKIFLKLILISFRLMIKRPHI